MYFDFNNEKHRTLLYVVRSQRPAGDFAFYPGFRTGGAVGFFQRRSALRVW